MAATPAEVSSMYDLTAAERAEGWQLLFGGQDTDAWRGFKKDALPHLLPASANEDERIPGRCRGKTTSI